MSSQRGREALSPSQMSVSGDMPDTSPYSIRSGRVFWRENTRTSKSPCQQTAGRFQQITLDTMGRKPHNGSTSQHNTTGETNMSQINLSAKRAAVREFIGKLGQQFYTVDFVKKG